MEPKDLSVAQLKKFRKHCVELEKFANNEKSRVEAKISINVIDEELENRGFDTNLLFNQN